MAVIISIKVSCHSPSAPGLDDDGFDMLLFSVRFPGMSDVAYIPVELEGRLPPPGGGPGGDTARTVAAKVAHAFRRATGPGGSIPPANAQKMTVEYDGGTDAEGRVRVIFYGATEVDLACTNGKVILDMAQPAGPNGGARLRDPPQYPNQLPPNPVPANPGILPPPVPSPLPPLPPDPARVRPRVRRIRWDKTFRGGMPTSFGKGRRWFPPYGGLLPLDELMNTPPESWWRVTSFGSVRVTCLRTDAAAAGFENALPLKTLVVPFPYVFTSARAQLTAIIQSLYAFGVDVRVGMDSFAPLSTRAGVHPVVYWSICTSTDLQVPATAFPWDIVMSPHVEPPFAYHSQAHDVSVVRETTFGRPEPYTSGSTASAALDRTEREWRPMEPRSGGAGMMRDA